MTFVRTGVGLANLHRFHNVDLVLFCEGGDTSFMPDEALSGSGTGACLDAKFWQYVLGTFLPELRIRVRAVGSKTAALAVYERIQKTPARSVAVAVDADFGGLFEELPAGPNIVATRGYSWESDVWRSEVMAAVVESFATGSTGQEDEAADAAFKSLSRGAKWGVRGELLLWQYGEMLWDRSSHGRHIDRTGKAPSIRRTGLAATVKAKRSAVQGSRCRRLRRGLFEIDVMRYLYGHLKHDFCYEAVRSRLKALESHWQIPKQTVGAQAIASFAMLLKTNSRDVTAIHYADALRELRTQHGLPEQCPS